jgi:hypothetical protein
LRAFEHACKKDVRVSLENCLKYAPRRIIGTSSTTANRPNQTASVTPRGYYGTTSSTLAMPKRPQQPARTTPATANVTHSGFCGTASGTTTAMPKRQNQSVCSRTLPATVGVAPRAYSASASGSTCSYITCEWEWDT